MRIHLPALFATLALALPLTAQDEADLFTKLDANKDGFVTADEVQDSNKALFERLLRNADKNADAKLSKDEFQAGLRPAEGPRPPLDGAAGTPGRPGSPGGNRPNPANFSNPQQLEALFDRTDSNSDGKLTKDEIPEERQGMRTILERAGDSITKEQFVRGMLAMSQNPGQPPRPEGAPPRRPDGAPGGPPPGGGLFGALDIDRDGQLSNAEIVGAGSALLKLDRNGDGKLTPDEAFAGGPGGPGGPPGRPGAGRGAPDPARPGDRRPGDGPPPGERRPGQRGPGGQNPEEFRDRLKQADANNDGKISKDEAPPFMKERFDRLDANSDGFIDQEEARRLLDQRPRPTSDQPRREAGDKK